MINSFLILNLTTTLSDDKMVEIDLDKIAEILKENRMPEKVTDNGEDILIENHALINNIARDILKVIQVHHNFPTDDFLIACGIDLDEEFSKYK